QKAAAQYASLARYAPLTDVTEHSKIDIDQRGVEDCLALDPADFGGAFEYYSVGGASLKTDEIRTAQKCSTEAELMLNSRHGTR
ncbi:unnamed protein product, partial [Phaeothamnion confervicola]